ncbi:hypothetical protein P8C59_008164 [Phyllachora maydis]|uniref:Nucleolar complex protein 2 n=1 Tax=Phyllachora maydis TaxID=1825666 RepID=A0AAD9IB91_9PEZI|nr:hypothetical protein P8C59_008164 [Phyllachora maydis]
MASSKKNAKGTKKFEKKHLKGVLERRKTSAKIKQKQQIKDKKKTKQDQDAGFFKGADNEKASGDKKANGKNAGAKAAEMSVDDFFQGGFEILEKDNRKKPANGKIGKRKRDQPAEDEAQDSQEDSAFSEEPAEAAGEDDEVSDEDAEEEIRGMSKKTMEALAEKDPEFYKFLQETDPEALDFDENADLAEVDELSGSEAEEEQPKRKKRKAGKKAEEDVEEGETARATRLTLDMVKKWKKSLKETFSLRAARQIVLAFRSAARGDEAQDNKQQHYTISSPDVFHEVLIVALKQIPGVLKHHVPVKESAAGRVYVTTDSKKFKTLSLLMKSYTASIIHLLGTLSDEDKGIRETLLKAVYQGLVQGSRVTNPNTIQGINIMKNTAFELWGIDPSMGYTTAFTSIRQLAIHLRNSIVKNQNESFRAVYNWQYVHSLDFWSVVISEHCSSLKEAETGKESQLKLLVYPLVQVTLGSIRLIPTSAYFPLRFQLIRSLLRISRATGTYIPLASALLEVLNSAEMKKPPTSSTLKPLDFFVAYKAPKSYLRTRVYQDGVGEQVVELFGEYFALWATNIAFPEFALPVIVMLKRWLKETRGGKGGSDSGKGNKNAKLASSLVIMVQKLEANAKFIEERRAKVDFAPKNRAQVDAFLKDFDWQKTPVGAYVVAQRKMRAERRKAMEEARNEDESQREKDATGSAGDVEQVEHEDDTVDDGDRLGTAALKQLDRQQYNAMDRMPSIPPRYQKLMHIIEKTR